MSLELTLTDDQLDLWANWIDALETGNYLQTQGQLKGSASDPEHSDQIGYCCLGVYCEIDEDVVFTQNQDYIDDDHDTDWAAISELEDEDSSDILLPASIRQKLGIPEDVQDLLAKLNDAKTGFAGIAVYLRHVSGFKPQSYALRAQTELKQRFDFNGNKQPPGPPS